MFCQAQSELLRQLRMAHVPERAERSFFPSLLHCGGTPQGRNDLEAAVKKVIIDQLSYGPLQNALFVSFMAAIVDGALLWCFVAHATS